jgi:hypothetical protein
MTAGTTAPISTSTSVRPQPPAPPDRGSSDAFERLFSALQASPARAEAAPAPHGPVLVSAAAVNTALARVEPDRVLDALSAFKRDSWLTFTHAAASSVYASEPAPRGVPVQDPRLGPLGGVIAGLLERD